MKLTSVELIAVCPDPVIGVDNEGIINIFNRAAERLLGFNAENVIGTLQIATLYEREGEANNVNKLLSAESYGEVGMIEGYDTRIIGQDGQVFPVRLSAAYINDIENEELVGTICYFHDLTVRQELEENLRELSRTDHLTQMYNSRHLYPTLGDEITRSTRYKHPFGLICYSLNGLKEANDQLGHLVGDEVLKLLALVTRDTLRENDTGYRYTGNEFLIVCPETDYAGALRVAVRLEETFSELLPQALSTEFNELKSLVSLNQGVTVFYGGNTVSANELIHQAIQTMEKSKLDSEEAICLFEASMRSVQ